jgi:hypothetical protein
MPTYGRLHAHTCLGLALACGWALTAPHAALASTDEPAGLNLGDSSFMDGFGRTDPGLVYQEYFQIEQLNAIVGANGAKMSDFQGTNISSLVLINQLSYVSPAHLFGGSLGAEVLLPLVDLSASFAPNSPEKLTADSGFNVGDTTWGVFLQMPPVTAGGRSVFDQRFEFAVNAPTGQYNRADDINPSAGFWSFNPYWAMTFLPTQDTEISVRLYYLHNFENADPAGDAAPFRAGDAAWSNFTFSYKLIGALNVGLNGYAFQQIQNDTSDGRNVPGSETTDVAIGPGVMYALDSQNSLLANAYLPVVERNTTDGFHVILHWVHVF